MGAWFLFSLRNGGPAERKARQVAHLCAARCRPLTRSHREGRAHLFSPTHQGSDAEEGTRGGFLSKTNQAAQKAQFKHSDLLCGSYSHVSRVF